MDRSKIEEMFKAPDSLETWEFMFEFISRAPRMIMEAWEHIDHLTGLAEEERE